MRRSLCNSSTVKVASGRRLVISAAWRAVKPRLRCYPSVKVFSQREFSTFGTREEALKFLGRD